MVEKESQISELEKHVAQLEKHLEAEKERVEKLEKEIKTVKEESEKQIKSLKEIPHGPDGEDNLGFYNQISDAEEEKNSFNKLKTTKTKNVDYFIERIQWRRVFYR